MERWRAVLLTLLGVSGVWFCRITGAEVEMRVRPGDDVTLYSDCVWKPGFKTLWYKLSSNGGIPTILSQDTMKTDHPRYSFLWNPSNNTHDLLVKKISESDLGLYHCTLQKTKASRSTVGRNTKSFAYIKGNRTTRLCLIDSTMSGDDPTQTPSIPPVSGCSICWKLLVSVCPVCVVLIATCVCCIYRYRTKGSDERRDLLTQNMYQVGGAKEHQCEWSMKGKIFQTEVSYTLMAFKAQG